MSTTLDPLTDFQRYLSNLKACHEVREWAGERTAQQAWDECPDADWLLWWSAQAGADRKQIVRVACLIARDALPFVSADETRPLRCIETVEAWIDDRASVEDVRLARRAAYDAAVAAAARPAASFAAANAAHSATYAAVDAADAVYALADAAASAAADAAAYAYAAAATAASTKRREYCDLIRRELPFPGGPQ